MTIEELYRQLGGNYGEVLSRLKSEDLIKKLIKTFPDNPDYNNLCIALKYGDSEGAILSAESLLGICQNLGFSVLERSIGKVTAALKAGFSSVTDNMLSSFGSDYELTVFLTQKFSDKN